MTTVSVSDPLVGRVLDGRYEILSRVARGGMATVYRAQDRRLTREVAVKVMHDGLGDDADFARKFDREARAAARLSNQHVVSVFDQGVDLGRPYIVMEFVEGCTLRHVLTREAPLEPLRALDLLEPVVPALASAHESGLVHRDVKPENVLISNQGQIKVADFGLARAVTAQTVTATQGLLIGTVSYLPPELVTSGRANKRSDVYSTGILLYEMLTGQKPHKGDTPIQVAWSHVHNDVPPPSELMHADGRWRRDSSRIIPPYLDALVVACTRRQPALRPADGRELLILLRRARKALAQGIVDDPMLTHQMLASTRLEDCDLEPTEPSTLSRDLDRLHDESPDEVEPSRPVSFRQRSASSPTSSRTGRIRRTAERDGAPSVRMRAQTPTSPVDLPSERILWEPSGRTPATPVPAPSPRPLGATAARPSRSPRSPRSQQTPVFPHLSQDPVHRRRRGLVGLVMLLVIGLAGTGTGYWWFEHGRWTSAVALASHTEQQAVVEAQAAGFAITVTEEYSETVPKGTVISTSPKAGERVLKGATIQAVVSKGPERYALPSVVGQTLERATQTLEATHLRVGTVTKAYDEKAAADTVVSTSQKPGTRLKPGSAVDLVISQGKRPVTIPNLVGQNVDGSTKRLRDLGFKVAITRRHSDDVAKDAVMSQTPSKGTGHAGDIVTLAVSKGPVLVTVPAVTGTDEKTAAMRLKNAGFGTKVVYNTDAAMRLDVVALQDPVATKMAPKGSTVTIYVS